MPPLLCVNDLIKDLDNKYFKKLSSKLPRRFFIRVINTEIVEKNPHDDVWNRIRCRSH